MPLEFTKKNISGICGRYDSPERNELLEQTEKTLKAHEAALKNVMAQTGLTEDNLVTLLMGAGPYLGNAIDVLESHMWKLKRLAAIIDPVEISKRLGSSPARQLSGSIDQLLEEYAERRLASGKIPPASDIEARFASPAAKPETKRER